MARQRGDRGPTRTRALLSVAEQLGIDLDDPERSAELRDAGRAELRDAALAEEPSSIRRRKTWPIWAFLQYRRLLEGVKPGELSGGWMPAELDEMEQRTYFEPLAVAGWAYCHRRHDQSYTKIAERELAASPPRGYDDGNDPLFRLADAIKKAVKRHEPIWKLAENSPNDFLLLCVPHG